MRDPLGRFLGHVLVAAAKPGSTPSIEDDDLYRQKLDMIEGRIGAGRLQLGEGLIEIDFQNAKGALARCGDAETMIATTEAEVKEWQALPTEVRGRRKIDSIVRFNRLVPELRDLKSQVEQCLDAVRSTAPAAPKAPPAPADATS